MSLKADSQRYFLGYLWWVLEPLLWLAVFYLVFEVFLTSGHPDFLVFLAIGKLTFIWFSKSVSQAANSLIANRGLIGRLDSPKWLFPVSVCHEGLYKQATVFLVLLVVLFCNEFVFATEWLWLVPLALLQYVLIVAVGMFAALLVALRQDFQYLVQLGMVFLMFTSGVFWDVDSIADAAVREKILLLNPMAALLDLYRGVLMEATRPSRDALLVIFIQGVLLLGLVVWAYQRLRFWIASRVVYQ